MSPIVDSDRLPDSGGGWKADTVICTPGATIRKADTQKVFRQVDRDDPLAVTRLGKKHGTPTFVLTSTIGADVDSRFFSNRVKGEVECDLAQAGFDSPTVVRPGPIGSGIGPDRLKRFWAG